MRLKSLKLSGFKSFVDTGYFKFPSNLVGIVGPNGCGKSNIIDAVRWVMGERSAKHLRGDSMSDVIFNGAKTRKPVGKATVEMIFDNSLGRVTGKYAAYNDISIKRSVDRDGQSDYFLNNIKVRRRDVMDLFAGTGLGPRSYTIIEQGMISKFIEAKPADIRNMLEEAAGVAQYKERRRETENRIKHTKENLARINDLSEEITKNIKKLERQAKIAQQYQNLKEQQKLINAQLLSVQWNKQQSLFIEWQHKITQQTITLESKRSKLQENSTNLEKLHQQKITQDDKAANAQKQFYQTKTALLELEQKEKTLKQLLTQTTIDLGNIDINESTQNLVSDKENIKELSDWLMNNQSDLQKLENKQKEAKITFDSKEQAWLLWQKKIQQLTQEINLLEKDRSSAESTMKQAEIKKIELQNYNQSLENEKKDLSLKEDNDLEKIYKSKKNELDNLKEQSSTDRENVAKSKIIINQITADLNKKQQIYQQYLGKLSSLKTLQQNLLSSTQNTKWLNNNHLINHPRLAELIQVESGFELASEVVLADFLEAICLENNKIPDDWNADINIVLLQKYTVNNPHTSDVKFLASKIKSDYDLSSKLDNVLIVDSLNDALKIKNTLNNNESVVTKTGIWFGFNWIRILAKNQNSQQSILELKQSITQVEQEIDHLKSSINLDEQQLNKLSKSHIFLENILEEHQSEFNKIQSIVSNLQSEQSAIIAKNEQINIRKERIKNEQHKLIQRLETLQSETHKANIELNKFTNKLETLQTELANLEQNKENILEDYSKAKLTFQDLQVHFQKLSSSVDIKKTKLEATEKHTKWLAQQLTQVSKQQTILDERRLEIEEQLPEIKSAITKMINTQIHDELLLKSEKQKLNDIGYQYQENIKHGQSLTQLIQDLEMELHELKVSSQESLILKKTLKEQIDATGFVLETLLTDMDNNHKTIEDYDYYQDLAKIIETKIQQLGEINFTAIGESEIESKRKTYIDQQVSDLTEALETLETAIKTIDKETKDRFKQTFDLVNNGIQQIFPKLFGGGKAYLQLDSSNLLETGVTIMAQPPGKRNSSIHLLSGGEKALTAISLVFAIFELNPAPFCMLDEVDAPLDDANVTRFCDMVKKMSNSVQFIFITHNKTTMALSEQLVGITTQEPGVSRLVTVDLVEATQMTNI